jgi:PII-like signaling protein
MKIVTIARIYIKEGDKIENHNLMQEIFKLLHDQHKVHGVTVFRGVAGFGSRGGEVHADDLLRLIVHLPLVAGVLRRSRSRGVPAVAHPANGARRAYRLLDGAVRLLELIPSLER